MEHVDPSYKFTTSERDEFLRVAHVLAIQDELVRLNNREKRRNYRRWSLHEIHSLLVAISILGYKDHDKLSKALTGRTPAMVSLIRLR